MTCLKVAAFYGGIAFVILLICSGIFGGNPDAEPATDLAVSTETAPKVTTESPKLPPTPVKPKTQLFEVVESSRIPNIKYSIEYRYTGSGLPTRAELRYVSDEVERRQPGYQRYFVGFYLPQQPAGEGYFATAHRDPDVEINIMSFMVPDRMQELSDFYGQ